MDTNTFQTGGFSWDGTDLGVYDSDIICNCISTNIEGDKNDVYWKLNIRQISEIVIAKTFKDSHQLIIDEIKPLFGIPKLGTHTIVIDKKKYIIIRPAIVHRNSILFDCYKAVYPDCSFFIFHDLALSNIGNIKQMPSQFKDQIRRLIVLRYLLSVQTFQTSFYLRTTSFNPKLDQDDSEITVDGVIVTSDYNGFSIKDNVDVIPNILINQYFTQHVKIDEENMSSDRPSMEYVFTTLIKKSIKILGINVEDLSTTSYDSSDQLFNAWILKFSSNIEKIVRRIDTKLLWIIQTIVRKIIDFKDRHNLNIYL